MCQKCFKIKDSSVLSKYCIFYFIIKGFISKEARVLGQGQKGSCQRLLGWIVRRNLEIQCVGEQIESKIILTELNKNMSKMGSDVFSLADAYFCLSEHLGRGPFHLTSHLGPKI